MNQISSGAQQVNDVITEISSAIKEQSVATANIARNVERVAQMLDESHASSQGASSTILHLADLAAELEIPYQNSSRNAYCNTSRSISSTVTWRTSRPLTIYTTYSDIFLAWSPMRSMALATNKISSAVEMVRGSSIIKVIR